LTTLDLFLKNLPQDIHLISGHQKTPSSLELIYSEEDFLKLIEFFTEDKFVFRFLEKTPKGEFFVHLAFLKGGLALQIAIEVRNRSNEFKTKLCALFSAAEAYLNQF
jgi:hypothetical protein